MASKVTMLHSAEEISGRVGALAQAIAETLPDDFVIVGLLKGSFVFVADLARALSQAGVHAEIEFMRLSSYGLTKVSAGEVHLIGDVPTNIAGRTLLLVDDILDTGRSLAYARALLEQREAARIWTCVLVDKPSRREVEVAVEFVGFTLPDVFIAGYGIDYAEKYRCLPFIGKVD
jgi:hypoxanthine phosphoribosyltransferase